MVEKIKNIANLTTEELGRLFPIEIVPYNQKWKELFERENKRIREKLGRNTALRTEHFGSTAVEGLSAKPIIDILVEIPPLTQELKSEIIKKMADMNYHFIWRTDEEIPYTHFVKGYTNDGFKEDVFHIHMGEKNHALWDRIFFRDFLRLNKSLANEYEKLKIELAKKYKFNREHYTNAKTDFVKRITAEAKKRLQGKQATR